MFDFEHYWNAAPGRLEHGTLGPQGERQPASQLAF